MSSALTGRCVFGEYFTLAAACLCPHVACRRWEKLASVHQRLHVWYVCVCVCVCACVCVCVRFLDWINILIRDPCDFTSPIASREKSRGSSLGSLWILNSTETRQRNLILTGALLSRLIFPFPSFLCIPMARLLPKGLRIQSSNCRDLVRSVCVVCSTRGDSRSAG